MRLRSQSVAVVLAAAVCLLAIIGLAAAQSPPPPTPRSLRTAVLQALLLDPELRPYPLAAAVAPDFSVTLYGRLPTEFTKDHAADIAKAVPGVQHVHNKIRIDRAVEPLVLPPAQALPRPPPSSASAQPAAPAPSPDSDPSVQAAIAAALRLHPALDQVSVEVRGNSVQLSGHVPTELDKARAGALAANLAGARKILNRIKVGSPPRATPAH